MFHVYSRLYAPLSSHSIRNSAPLFLLFAFRLIYTHTHTVYAVVPSILFHSLFWYFRVCFCFPGVDSLFVVIGRNALLCSDDVYRSRYMVQISGSVFKLPGYTYAF